MLRRRRAGRRARLLRRSRRCWTRRLVNGYVTEQAPWQLAKDPDRAGPRPGALRHGRGAAGAGRAAQPGDAEGVRRAVGVARCARPRSARSPRSRVQDAGRWGQLPAGSQVSKGEVLFPRLPDEEPARRRLRARGDPPAAARALAAAGGRQPLPPRPDRACRSRTTLLAAEGAGVEPDRDRSAATSRAAQWAASTAAREPGVVRGGRPAPERGSAASS